MAIDNPVSDLTRAKQHEQDHSWPHAVKVAVHWMDSQGRVTVRSETISSDQFFGERGYGAPLTGDWVISLIARMRREGPPKVRRGRRRD